MENTNLPSRATMSSSSGKANHVSVYLNICDNFKSSCFIICIDCLIYRYLKILSDSWELEMSYENVQELCVSRNIAEINQSGPKISGNQVWKYLGFCVDKFLKIITCDSKCKIHWSKLRYGFKFIIYIALHYKY